MGTFLLVDQDEYDELANQGDEAIVNRVLIGWGDDLRDADKQPLAFCTEVRDAMNKRAYLRTAIIQTYMKSFLGARRGN